jgi:hypothetical protein
MMIHPHPWAPAALVALALTGCATVHPTSPPAPETTVAAPPAATVPIRSSTEDPRDGPCVQTARGCVALNPDVTEADIAQTICAAGYTRSVRPASSYTKAVKARLMREQGIDASRIGEFELDHIVPLALGGHPRKLSNLMLQPWDGPQGAHMKDILEVRLQSLVCHGKVRLTAAQVCIATDWESCEMKYPRP